MKWVFKYLSIIIAGYFLRFLFSFFPIKKETIAFISFGGGKISCNPLYIYRYILSNYPHYNCKWIVNDTVIHTSIPDRQIVKNGSFAFYKLMLTAGFIITNDRLPSYLFFRKGQFIVNTWHGGGAFKRTFGYPKGLFKWYVKKTTLLDSNRTNLFLSSSKMWSDVIARKSFLYKGDILGSGFPRNDVFWGPMNRKKHIRNLLGVEDNLDVILYAPTYRDINGITSKLFLDNPIDLAGVRKAWNEKFHNNCIILFRGHHAMKRIISYDCAIDVSNYPDMQDLLLVSSALISDYSSCMWDFALTKRPCFIYAPDFDQYLNSPGFESDFHQWPFIITRNNKELIFQLYSFDLVRYQKRVDDYLDLYGSYENGNAAQQVCNHLLSIS